MRNTDLCQRTPQHLTPLHFDIPGTWTFSHHAIDWTLFLLRHGFMLFVIIFMCHYCNKKKRSQFLQVRGKQSPCHSILFFQMMNCVQLFRSSKPCDFSWRDFPCISMASCAPPCLSLCPTSVISGQKRGESFGTNGKEREESCQWLPWKSGQSSEALS